MCNVHILILSTLVEAFEARRPREGHFDCKIVIEGSNSVLLRKAWLHKKHLTELDVSKQQRERGKNFVRNEGGAGRPASSQCLNFS